MIVSRIIDIGATRILSYLRQLLVGNSNHCDEKSWRLKTNQGPPASRRLLILFDWQARALRSDERSKLRKEEQTLEKFSSIARCCLWEGQGGIMSRA